MLFGTLASHSVCCKWCIVWDSITGEHCFLSRAQEPSGPEAAAAMAGLEVEVRCYKHVQEATLAELTTALQHLDLKQAKGQGLGSWSSDQLVALRTEVARKQAAEALTQLGDAALEALTRKMNSYHSEEGALLVPGLSYVSVVGVNEPALTQQQCG